MVTLLAEECARIGFANRVVKVGTAVEESIRLASQIAAFPQSTMRSDRKSLRAVSFFYFFDSRTFADVAPVTRSPVAHWFVHRRAGR